MSMPVASPVTLESGTSSVNNQKPVTPSQVPLLDRVVQAASVVALVVLAVIAGLGIVSMVASGQLLLGLAATVLGAVAFAVTLLALNRGGFLSTVRQLEFEVDKFSAENAQLTSQVSGLKSVNESLTETNESLSATNANLKKTSESMKFSAKQLAIVGEDLEKASLQLTDTSVDLKATTEALSTVLAQSREGLAGIASASKVMDEGNEAIQQLVLSLQATVSLLESTISKQGIEEMLEEMRQRSDELKELKDCCSQQKEALEGLKKESAIQAALNQELSQTVDQLKFTKGELLRSIQKQAEATRKQSEAAEKQAAVAKEQAEATQEQVELTRQMSLAANDQLKLVAQLNEFQSRLERYLSDKDLADIQRTTLQDEALRDLIRTKLEIASLVAMLQKAIDEAVDLSSGSAAMDDHDTQRTEGTSTPRAGSPTGAKASEEKLAAGTEGSGTEEVSSKDSSKEKSVEAEETKDEGSSTVTTGTTGEGDDDEVD
ncbi:hypothetical protein [Chlamydiifrater volucris]|uniref:hypothetical protein n=1 Tax=Chlamydiifrater volucris TaxID=2681470 RepID=UPI001BD1559A|nr:hypothetical protein [Chlamydiifrater volucris]